MKSYPKSDDAYRTIGEVTKELGLIDKKTGHLKTHTLRYWETHFKQIKPLIRAGKRRYYSKKNFQIIKLIKFLLKENVLWQNQSSESFKLHEIFPCMQKAMHR